MGSIRNFKIFAGTLLSVLLLALAGHSASAQSGRSEWASPADSLASLGQISPDSLNNQRFNAIKYSMQKRYRPEDEKVFEQKKGFWFVAATSTADLLSDGKAGSYSWLKGADLYAGWRPFLYNAFRANLSYGVFTRNSDMSVYRRGGLGVEHNFYVLSYLYGYRMLRPLDVYTVAGLGMDLFVGDQSSSGKYQNQMSWVLAPWMKLGVGVQFKFSKRASFIVSPQYLFYFTPLVLNNASGIGNVGARQYKSAFSMKAGLQFDLGSTFREPAIEYSTATNPLFISLAGGFQFQNGLAMRNTTSLFSSMKESATISVGKWITTALGVRVSGFHGRDTWKTVFDPVQKQNLALVCQYDGLRAEFMVDPMAFVGVKQSRSDIRFSVPVIMGIEGGLFKKEDYNNISLNPFYWGFSCSVQPHYHFSKLFSVFIEPHCSFIPYSFNKVVEGKLQKSGENYWDAVISVSLGLEISIGLR